jgi:uncharacterized protein YkwD
MKRLGWVLALASGLALAGCSEAGSSCDDESEVCEVFRLVNVERAAAGESPLAWNHELFVAAQRHAEDMAAQDYFSHTSLDGRSFSDRTRDAGYDASPRGENIAAGYGTPAAVMDGWMNSSGHRRNILAAGSNELGVGLFDRRWVQVFGFRPAEPTE